MKVSTEKLENQQVKITIEIDSGELNKAQAKACKKIADRISIPGFRKGKAPKNVVERQVGKDYVLDEAFHIVYPKAVDDAIKTAGLSPVSQVDIDVVTLKDGEDLVFTASFTQHPEVSLGEYKGLAIEKESADVTDEDVEKEIDHIRTHHSKLIDAEENDAAGENDLVTLDFEGFIDGEPFEGGKGMDYPLELGSGTFIPGFEDQLVGAKVGEERDVNVTFPEDYHDKSFAGKPALFKCKIHSIKKRELPALDDEFAAKVSKFKTVDEFRADVRDRLTQSAERRADTNRMQAAIDKAAENITVDIPDVMIEEEIDRMMNELSLRLQQQGMSFEDYVESAGIDVGQLREGQREAAEKNVRINLMLEAVAKAENIEITPQDRAAEIVLMALTYNAKPQEINKIIKKQGPDAERNLQLTALRKKTAKFIFDNLAE